ncbi:hypothetical protein [Micromonospora echinofusca]|uniref:Uncharacterized protein n=1 Tax=Micromonospora echinofusca TaxID=47858 RepID=A0ABS3VYU4_MICEH|nr:hypothetical protein [Micromonospora echinofusca]MBO4209716.1 hypothetical protein [Micromonospora echinofusca]
MADEPDVALTVALAEYEHVREASRAIHDQSVARFNFFLAVASASTAVSAALITANGPGERVRLATVVGLGVLVLLLGVAVFARLVELNDRGRRYAVAATALRTYLTRRAPDLAPFMLMPTLDDPGPFTPEPFRRHWFRDAVGLPGTVGLVNSAVVASAAALGVAASRPGWVGALVGVGLLAGSVAAHLTVVRRRVARSARQVGVVLDRRPPLQPAADALGPAGTVPLPDARRRG